MAGENPSLTYLVTALVGAGAIGGVLVALWAYLRLGWRAARPVLSLLPPPDARRAATEALRHFQYVKGRVWGALFRGGLLLSLYALGIVVLGGGVFVLGAWGRLDDIEPSFDWWSSLSPVARYAGYFLVCGLAATVLVKLVFHCRVVMVVREGKTTRWRALAEELDTAIGHGGIFPTLLFGGLLAALAAGWFTLWGVAGAEAARMLGFEPATGAAIGLVAAAVIAWVLLFSAMFTFPILAVRDPGWLSALEASIGLLVLRRRAVWQAGLYASTLAATVYYWPAALWMLLDVIDDQMVLITVLLRERDPRMVIRELEGEAPAQEGALRMADQHLRAGRYLDALNIYQMFYYKNPMSVEALVGIAQSQLAIGNRTKAREALERLLILESSHPAGVRMMSELQQGLWDENGPLYQEARARCTQHLGKGVELKDTLDPALVRELKK